jgi:hypothetical protein
MLFCLEISFKITEGIFVSWLSWAQCECGGINGDAILGLIIVSP